MRHFIRTFSFMILSIFFANIAIFPALALDNNGFSLSAPDNVDRGNTFDVTVRSLAAQPDMKNVSLSVPAGFRLLSANSYADGTLTYNVEAPKDEGTYNLIVSIDQKEKGVQTLSRTLSVRKSFFDSLHPVVFWTGAVVSVALLSSLMTNRTGGKAGYLY